MKRFLNHPLAGVLIFGLILFACSFAHGQNVRYSVSFPSISSQTTTPYLVANVPPNSPILAVCNSPANQVPCTNYATTYNSAGAACSNGAQDTPDPQPSACQGTGDAQGNIGFWAPPGTYDYTVCIQNSTNCFGPYTVTLSPLVKTGAPLAHADYASKSANISSTTLYTPVNTGLFSIHYYANQTGNCGDPGPANVAINLIWTDSSTTSTTTLATLTFDTNPFSVPVNTITNGGASVDIWSLATTPIKFSTTYTACSIGTATYDFHIYVISDGTT